MKSLAFDIMTERCTKCYASLVYKYTPPIDMTRLFMWIFTKRPSLRWKSFCLLYEDNIEGGKEIGRIDYDPQSANLN